MWVLLVLSSGIFLFASAKAYRQRRLKLLKESGVYSVRYRSRNRTHLSRRIYLNVLDKDREHVHFRQNILPQPKPDSFEQPVIHKPDSAAHKTVRVKRGGGGLSLGEVPRLVIKHDHKTRVEFHGRVIFFCCLKRCRYWRIFK